MASILNNGPVSLPHLRMVKRFAEHIELLGENGRLPDEHQPAWAGYFQQNDMTMQEADSIGAWYAKHHTICPSISDVMSGLRFLRKHKTMPSQRLACNTEVLAGALLQFLSERQIELHEATRALSMASALAHGAYYRMETPDIEREYVRSEFEGIARMADFLADDILNEVRQGAGSLGELECYLFNGDEADGL